MKKKILVIVSSFLFLLTLSYILVDKFYVEEIRNDSLFRIPPKNMKEILETKDLVIKGSKIGDSKNVIVQQDEFYDGYTLTQVKIQKIIKNNLGKKVNKGDVITVREPYFTYNFKLTPGSQFIIKGDYTKIEPNNKYVLALSWNEQMKFYGISGLEDGKFSVDKKDKKELTVTKDNVDHQKLNKEILNSFKEE